MTLSPMVLGLLGHGLKVGKKTPKIARWLHLEMGGPFCGCYYLGSIFEPLCFLKLGLT